jgi:uncharacterized protein (DUF3084 family)
MRKLYIPSIALAIGLTLAGCQGEAAEYGEDTGMGMASAEGTQLVDTFRADVRGRLDAIDRNIQQLREQADSATAEVQLELQARVDDFQRRSEQVEQQLRSLAYESETAWEQTKTLVTQTLETLGRDVEAAVGSTEDNT